MPERNSPKPQGTKKRRAARIGAVKKRKRLPPTNMPVMDQPFEDCIAHVRLAVKLLREAALSPIPDLDEVAPDRLDGYGKWKWPPSYPKESEDTTAHAKAVSDWERQYDQYEREISAWQRKHRWPERARSRAAEAFDWRDKLVNRIGSVHVENQRPYDAAWPPEKLSKELGYWVSNPGPSELSEGWGPPESLLGEFYEPSDFATSGQHRLIAPIEYLETVRLLVQARLVKPGDIKVDTEHLEPQGFWEVSPHFNKNDAAREFLGPPPRHLTYPTYKRLDRRIWSSGANRHLEGNEFIHPYKWREYAEVILQQCLLERTRALELCAWCDQRIEAWQSAFYPTIIIGPEIWAPKKKQSGDPIFTGRRHLRVTIAGTTAPDTPDTIIASLARDLLLLRDGLGGPVDLGNADAQADKLRKLIPLLGPFLIRDGDGRYRLPMGMIAIRSDTSERIWESKTWPPQTQE